MDKVILVKIESRNDLLHFRSQDVELKIDDSVIIQSITGEELGTVVKHFGETFSAIRSVPCIPQIVRKASNKDIESFGKKNREEKRAHEYCQNRIKEREIPIKLVRVTFFSGEKKAIFYFTSEGRIDFRDLVKDLAKKFRMRIEMRQIGIRDEAKMIGGVGICGRQLCCKTFLNNLEPITLQMAKKQNLNMNPVKISGMCGRLMCCLSYEETVGGRVVIEDQDERVGYDEEDDLVAENKK
jgi:cell fate regulator YaaT (PSP1 superfamily)